MTIVLVVEDDPLVRLTAAMIVEEAGCTVLEAATADEAIAVIEQGAGVDLVFSDVEMPGALNGLGLAQVIADRWPPQIGVILTSGQLAVGPGNLPPKTLFTAKPYSQEAIVRSIAVLVGR